MSVSGAEGGNVKVSTCDNPGVDVKCVIDGVDGAFPVVPLTEGERTPIYAHTRHIGVPSQ